MSVLSKDELAPTFKPADYIERALIEAKRKMAEKRIRPLAEGGGRYDRAGGHSACYKAAQAAREDK